MMNQTTLVAPGQLWADNDQRAAGRTLRVLAVEGEHAILRVESNPTPPEHGWPSWYRQQDTVGKTRRVLLRRMKPTNTGYRLVEEAP